MKAIHNLLKTRDEVTPLLTSGLHHVTAIASDPQRNLDFYADLLGLRLVKRTVNFDDPGTYHLYYGDAPGTPGTILTFFSWPGARRGVPGTGEVETTAFAIPSGSVGFWLERFKAQRVNAERVASRFGEEVIHFTDPDGLRLELIATGQPAASVRPWAESTVPPEHSLRGFHGVSAALKDPERTATLLTETFGYQAAGETGKRFRFVAPGQEDGPGKFIDLIRLPDGHPGRAAVGSVHHIAFRVPDDEQQLAWRSHLAALGYGVSPVMDRTYFRSIYFREPGGILFEIATDPPGFTFDESLEELGTHLRLPPQVEHSRAQIERSLPTITLPTTTTAPPPLTPRRSPG